MSTDSPADSPFDGIFSGHWFDSYSDNAPSSDATQPTLRSSPEVHEAFAQALEGAQALSRAAAKRCETARLMLEPFADEESDDETAASGSQPAHAPSEANERLRTAHTYAVQVIWQLRSIATDLDQTLRELEARADQ